MAKFVIAAVKDELSGSFLQPTFGESKEELLRIFKYQINNIPIWKENPSDFSFYILGKFDEETGIIAPDMVKIASGTSVLNREEKEE